MRFILRAIKRELFSVATILFVFVPLMKHSGDIPTSDALVSTARDFVSDRPAENVKTMMQGIGQAEANMVIRTFNLRGSNSLVTGHGPIFIASTADTTDDGK